MFTKTFTSIFRERVCVPRFSYINNNVWTPQQIGESSLLYMLKELLNIISVKGGWGFCHAYEIVLLLSRKVSCTWIKLFLLVRVICDF